MLIQNPFTPKSGMEPRVFIDRDHELEFFKQALRDAQTGRPSHFIVLGEWGSGKTSLFREFKNIAQKHGSLCSLVSVRGLENRDSLRDAIDYLVEEIALRLPLDVAKFKKFAGALSSAGVTVAGTGFHFSREIRRGDPQPFFYINLLNLWSDLKKETKVLVVLLDDIQNFSPLPVVMSVLRNVLADEKIVKETKMLFVLASTSDGWKPFLQRNHPIGRYFTPRMKLGNLTEMETYQLIDKHLAKSGVSFSKDVKKLVYRHTNGHLYETQVLCNHLFNSQINGKVSPRVFDAALNRTLETLGEEIFNDLFEAASPDEQLVLSMLSEYPEPVAFSAISLAVYRRHNIPKNRVADILERLVSKRIIGKPSRAVYTIDDTIFRIYIKWKMGEVIKVRK